MLSSQYAWRSWLRLKTGYRRLTAKQCYFSCFKNLNRLLLLVKVIDNKIKTIFFPFKLCHRTRPTRTILKSELSSNIFIMKNDYETHWKKSLAVTPSIFSLCRCGVFKAQYKRPTILVGNVRCFVSIRHLCDDNCVLGSWFASQTKCHIELGKKIKGIPNYVINHI